MCARVRMLLALQNIAISCICILENVMIRTIILLMCSKYEIFIHEGNCREQHLKK